MLHDSLEISLWIKRFAELIPAGGRVLELACGGGRHSRFLLARGHPVLAVDRDTAGISDLAGTVGFEIMAIDLEDGRPWPLGGQQFAGVLVTNYLYRPHLPAIVGAVGAGGCLLYETFAQGNELMGKPSNLDFLLRPGELLEAVAGRLQVVAYENLRIDQPRPAMVQRIAASRPAQQS
ncbi:MAG: class I SAM-dependent methyltransferase [Dongiaceae bacterium]